MTKPLTILATLIALFASPAFAQQEMAPKTQYKAGTSLKNSYFGVGLTVPQGFTGAYSEDGGKRALVAASPDGNMLLIVLFQNGVPLSAYENQLAQPVPVGKFTLEPQAAPSRQGNLVFVPTADAANGVSGFSAATAGAGGSSVILVGLAAPGFEQTLIARGDALLGGLQFFKSQIASADAKAKNTWKAQLAGRALSRSGGTPFNSSQNGSVSNNSRTQLTLCQSGQYAFSSESLMSVSIPGGDSLSNSSSSASNGVWAVEFATQNAAILVLTDETGAQTRVSVTVKGNAVLLDGQAVAVGQAGC